MSRSRGVWLRVLAGVGTLALVLPMNLAVVSPASAVGCDASWFAGGAGTLTDPYLIETAAQLAAVDDDAACVDLVFMLNADIDLSSIPAWAPLTPNASWPAFFSGVLYGNCHTIDNMTVNDLAGDGSQGLFGYTEGAEIGYLRVTNASVAAGGDNAAILIGDAEDTVIEGVSVDGTVTGPTGTSSYYYGGLAGDNTNTVIKWSHSSGTIGTAADATNGLSYVGGFTGYGSATVDQSYSEAAVTADLTVGGLGTDSTVITNSYATGDVTGRDSVGGLKGNGYGEAVTDAYAVGRVTATAGTKTGGLIGRVGSSFTPGVIQSYTDSFWDATTTGQATTATGTDASNLPLTTTTGAKTTAQMKTASTFAAWDADIWNIQDGSYPTLKWFDNGGLDSCTNVTSTTEVAAEGGSVTVSGVGLDAIDPTSVTVAGASVTVGTVADDGKSMMITVPAGSGTVALAFSYSKFAGVTLSGTGSVTYAPAGEAPSRPKQPVIVAGDGKVTVTVARGAGGGVPASFTVSADPGTGSCTVTSTTGGSCTISSGLTNGTAYTVRVRATNEFGTSPASAASEVFVPGPPVTPTVQPVSARQPAGGSALIVNGQPVPVVVVPNPSVNGLEISAAGLTMTLDGLNANGNPMNLDANGVLILGQDRNVQSTGTGFMPNSDVLLYVDPKVRAVGGRSKGIYVGTLRTNGKGAFRGSKPLPAGISAGVHDLQAVGVTPGNLTRALTLGVKVATTPSAVRNLAVERATGKGKVLLSWRTPGDDGGSPVIRYQVAYRFVLASAWAREPNVTDTSDVIADLIPGCRYDVRVRAVNGVGAGPWAMTTVAIPAPGRMRLPAGDLRCLLK